MPTGTDHTNEPEYPDNVTPFRPSKRHGRIRIDRIDTEPMTPEQYQSAITALATLFNHWKNNHGNQPESGEKAA